MRLRAFIYGVHIWASLALGAQVLVWMASGVVMSVFDLALVRGETNAVPEFRPELEARSYAAPGGVIAQVPGATEIRLTTLLGRPVYEAKTEDGVTLFDAETSQKLSPITEEMALAAAKSDYAGAADIAAVELLDDPPHEYRGPKPVWRALVDDRLETRLYISRDTGRVVARRNTIWRVYDFFWMLHIMDYDERENFNNPLLKTTAIAGFVFALSGMVLMIWNLVLGRYGLKALWSKLVRRKSG
ncbi:MAG: hypothetical protein ACE5FO_01700 [Parvularculaceae bacterium]